MRKSILYIDYMDTKELELQLLNLETAWLLGLISSREYFHAYIILMEGHEHE